MVLAVSPHVPGGGMGRMSVTKLTAVIKLSVIKWSELPPLHLSAAHLCCCATVRLALCYRTVGGWWLVLGAWQARAT